MNQTKQFLYLIRLGIGNYSYEIPNDINWAAIRILAEKQGLPAIIVDGIEKLPETQRPPKEFLLQWIGEILQGYEYRYDAYCKAIAELAGFYNSHGYRMMVLKGIACGLNWPKPEHRPYGDIDIWQFGLQKEADKELKKEGIKIDSSHHHHTVFRWDDFMVENHYDFINVHHHRSNVEIEKIMKDLGHDDTHYIELYGKNVYLPSPNLHALFLIKHSMNDFTSFSITLRQVLDWAFFVEKYTRDINWKWLLEVIDRYHMKDFFNCINAICVEDLGFSSSIFPTVQFLPSLKDRVLNDIIEPLYTAAEPKGLFKRLSYKYCRWQGNAWKHEMCYNESMWSAFLSGVWNHLLKPSSI